MGKINFASYYVNPGYGVKNGGIVYGLNLRKLITYKLLRNISRDYQDIEVNIIQNGSGNLGAKVVNASGKTKKGLH